MDDIPFIYKHIYVYIETEYLGFVVTFLGRYSLFICATQTKNGFMKWMGRDVHGDL